MLFVTWWTVHSLIALRVGIQQNVVYLPLSSHFSKLCSLMATCLIGFDLKYYLPKNIWGSIYISRNVSVFRSVGNSFDCKVFLNDTICFCHGACTYYIKVHEGIVCTKIQHFYNQRSSMTKYMMACVYFAISNTITHHACEEFELYNCTARSVNLFGN